MTNPRVLISGGHVVSMDPSVGELAGGDVLIEGDTIAAVGHNLDAGDAERVDATGSIVMPGLVDTHRHTWQTALRGFGADFTAQEYRSCIRGSFGRHMRPSDVYAATLLGALEALDSGITTMVDWAHIMNSPEHADASIDALVDSGMRAVFGYGTPNDAETTAWYQRSVLPHPADVRRVRETRLADDDALVTMAVATRPPHIVEPEVMVHDWRLARELNLRVTTDGGLGGGSWNGVPWGPGGHQPIRALHQHGLLDARTTFVHCNNLPDDELKLIADAGATVSVSPDSEMHVGHSFPVTGRAFALGIRPSLSIDIVIQVGGDLFGAMRSLLVTERGAVGARTYAEGGGPGPWEITTKDVLEFATVEGARATGMADRIGSLTPGKQADLVILKAGELNLEPMNNAVGLIVLQAHPGNVDSVYVAGQLVKRDGALAPALVTKALSLATASRDHLFATAGLTPGWGFRPPLQPQWRW